MLVVPVAKAEVGLDCWIVVSSVAVNVSSAVEVDESAALLGPESDCEIKKKNSTVDDTPEPPLSAPPPLLLPLPLPMASGSFMYASDTLKVAELIRWW